MLNITKYQVAIELCEPLLGTVPKDRNVFTRFVQAKAREVIEKLGGKVPPVPLTDGSEPTTENIDKRMAEEIETAGDVEEKGWTTFHMTEAKMDDGGTRVIVPPMPFLYDYHIKGFVKEAARMLKTWKAGGNEDEAPEEDEEEKEEEAAEGEGEEKAKKGKAKGKKKGGLEIKQLNDKVSRYVFVQPRRIMLTPEVDKNPLERPIRCMTMQGPRVTVTKSDVIPLGHVLRFEIHVLQGAGIIEATLADLLEYGLYQGLGQWRSGGYGRFQVVELKKKSGGAPAKAA